MGFAPSVERWGLGTVVVVGSPWAKRLCRALRAVTPRPASVSVELARKEHLVAVFAAANGQPSRPVLRAQVVGDPPTADASTCGLWLFSDIRCESYLRVVRGSACRR